LIFPNPKKEKQRYKQGGKECKENQTDYQKRGIATEGLQGEKEERISSLLF
jgi:hypothetical protein